MHSKPARTRPRPFTIAASIPDQARSSRAVSSRLRIRATTGSRELDLAFADDVLRRLRNALPEPVDSAFRMTLGGAERADHLCTDFMYRRPSGKFSKNPSRSKRTAILRAVFGVVAEREDSSPPSPGASKPRKIGAFRATGSLSAYHLRVPQKTVRR